MKKNQTTDVLHSCNLQKKQIKAHFILILVILDGLILLLDCIRFLQTVLHQVCWQHYSPGKCRLTKKSLSMRIYTSLLNRGCVVPNLVDSESFSIRLAVTSQRKCEAPALSEPILLKYLTKQTKTIDL